MAWNPFARFGRRRLVSCDHAEGWGSTPVGGGDGARRLRLGNMGAAESNPGAGDDAGATWGAPGPGLKKEDGRVGDDAGGAPAKV